MIEQFKCKDCPMSGKGPHERCPDYYRIKQVNDNYRESQAQVRGYNSYKQGVYEKAERLKRWH